MTAIAACRTCGTEPLENARFCHGCGSPVAGSDTHAEYKQVTVLFDDGRDAHRVHHVGEQHGDLLVLRMYVGLGNG